MIETRSAYVRVPREDRCATETSARYKKGFELRIPLVDLDEEPLVTELLAVQGLSPGRPFLKEKQWILPVYGARAVELFRRVRGIDTAGKVTAPARALPPRR